MTFGHAVMINSVFWVATILDFPICDFKLASIFFIFYGGHFELANMTCPLIIGVGSRQI